MRAARVRAYYVTWVTRARARVTRNKRRVRRARTVPRRARNRRVRHCARQERIQTPRARARARAAYPVRPARFAPRPGRRHRRAHARPATIASPVRRVQRRRIHPPAVDRAQQARSVRSAPWPSCHARPARWRRPRAGTRCARRMNLSTCAFFLFFSHCSRSREIYTPPFSQAFSACLACPAGAYCAVYGASSASGVCTGGFVCTQGATAATPVDNTTGYACPAGTFCPPGALTPSMCLAGTYQADTGRSVCAQCPSGSLCVGFGLTNYRYRWRRTLSPDARVSHHCHLCISPHLRSQRMPTGLVLPARLGGARELPGGHIFHAVQPRQRVAVHAVPARPVLRVGRPHHHHRVVHCGLLLQRRLGVAGPARSKVSGG